MKKFLGLLSICFLVLSFKGSEGSTGIAFESITLVAAKAKALTSNKYIFIDAYTSWCGPCKQMAATSFKDPEVVKLFNAKFINLKIDCEKDPDGYDISATYKVRAYPTLLVIDGTGKLIKQVVGFQTAEKLIALANSL